MSRLTGILPISGRPSSDFPLLSSKVHYDLVDVQSLATLVLTYASNAPTEMEVKYVCPLPADASVCSFKAVIDGKRTVRGVVKDKVKAKAEYDAAVAQGKTAALLRQTNVEIFQVLLGNIQPEQIIDIYISFVSLITGNGELDSLRLVFPCVIARRYGTPPNDLLSFSRSVKSALDFSASIQMTSHIKSITSPSRPVSLSLGSFKSDADDGFDPFKAHVALTSQDHLDKDIIIVITCQGLDKPRCTMESYLPEEGGEEFTDAYSLTLVPRFELPPLRKQEYIFLVDRSGSMRSKMNAVRAALQIMLRSLPSTDTTFNIFSFGSRHDSLWPSSVAYGTESLKTATTYVDEMQSNYGGTEIGSALQGVLQTHTDTQDVPLTVFVLTDGQSYNLPGVQSMIAQHVDKYVDKDNFVRIFCMGIGKAASKAMCDLIARVGRGTALYVGENEKPDKKLMNLLRAARGPVITNISVDWGVKDKDINEDDGDDGFELVEPEANTTPVSLYDEKAIPKDDISLGPLMDIRLPPPPKVQQAPTNSFLNLYPGFRTSIFAIIKRDNNGNSAPFRAVRVTGIAQGRPVELEVPVTAVTIAFQLDTTSDFDKVKLLHVLAARVLVQRFEDEGKKDGVMSDTLKAEVLRVAVRYGIASSETSFVAVDEEGVPLSTPATGNITVPATRRNTTISDAVTMPTSSIVSLPSMNSTFSPLPCARIMTLTHASFTSSTQTQADQLSLNPTLTEHTPDTRTDMLRALENAGAVFATSSSSSTDNTRPIYRSQSKRCGAARSTRFSLGGGKDDTLELSISSIARYQTFEGYFEGSSSLYQLLVQKDTLPPIPDVLQQLNVTPNAETVWCTVLCIACLRVKFPEDESVWELIVEKGERWISDTLGSSVSKAEDVAALVGTLGNEAKNCIV